MVKEYESMLVWLTMNHEAVLSTLQRLNSEYGRGDIRSYDAARQTVDKHTFKVHRLSNGAVSLELHGHRARVPV
jgi:hypothetical protein